MYYLSEKTTVYLIVVLFCLVGAVSTGLAVWRADPAHRVPNVDGNFFATLSQSNVALAAIYCIVIPILRGARNPVGRPWIFFCWLVLGVLAAFVSSVVYPFCEGVCLAAGYVSAVAQLAATLQWIQGSSRRIINLEEELVRRPWRP